jgi:predicted DsbA family dithiol-disulfide isomerase
MALCLPDGTCIDPETMPVRELKAILKKNNVDLTGIVEKSELVDLVFQHPPKSLSEKKVIDIEIVSDTMCPWCFVGKRHLEKAMSKFKDREDVKFNITWQPFFLNANLPDEGVNFRDYIARVYGRADYLDEGEKRLKDVGSRAGINFAFGKERKVYPTIDSHRLVHWAKRFGPEYEDKVVEKLFVAHFEEGQKLNDHNMLCRVAEEVGLDPVKCREYLNTMEDEYYIRDMDKKFKRGHRGVNGVPHYFISSEDTKEPMQLSGAQPPERFEAIINRLL